ILRRGRPRDALRILEHACDHAVRCDQAPLLLDVATTTGEAWTDLARLDDAERVFRCALASARVAGDRSRAAATATGLARSLFWRGAYTDATATLDGETKDALTESGTVRRLRMAARTRIASGHTSDALAALGEARDVANASGDVRMLVDVEHSEAF